MVKVRPWCGQPSDRGRLKTEQNMRAPNIGFTFHLVNSLSVSRLWQLLIVKFCRRRLYYHRYHCVIVITSNAKIKTLEVFCCFYSLM